jgi:hypothetical protein
MFGFGLEDGWERHVRVKESMRREFMGNFGDFASTRRRISRSSDVTHLAEAACRR